MDKKFIDSIVTYYNLQRVLSFARKREKSIVIPHIAFYIERLVNAKRAQNHTDQIDITILDIGCANGILLRVIKEVLKVKKQEYKGVTFRLFGWDMDEDLINDAKANFKGIDFKVVDLLNGHFEQYFGKFDLVISVNTLHEVFSTFLIDEKEKSHNQEQHFLRAKKRIKQVFLQLSSILSQDGTLVLFDGLHESGDPYRTIRFRIKNPVLANYVQKVIKDNNAYTMNISNVVDDIYEANYRDFSNFTVNFKFLNSKLWEIQSNEIYHYFTCDEFTEIFEEMGLSVESVNTVSNDLGLYNENMEILTPGEHFPAQSIMIVGSRRYIPTEFDYFCAEMNTQSFIS